MQIESILRKNAVFSDFEVDYNAPGFGRIMFPNARRVVREGSEATPVLLAVEVITARE